jgi:hypothetical protein
VECTAVKLLEAGQRHGVDAVDPATANRNDISCFWLLAWTHDVTAIPAIRWLAVPEPGHGDRLLGLDGRRRPRTDVPKVLRYRIRLCVSRWLIGDVSGPSDGLDERSPLERDAEENGSAGDAGAGVLPGSARRRRRRRAPRRRR